jgi:hypothetical protein
VFGENQQISNFVQVARADFEAERGSQRELMRCFEMATKCRAEPNDVYKKKYFFKRDFKILFIFLKKVVEESLQKHKSLLNDKTVVENDSIKEKVWFFRYDTIEQQK